MRHALLPAALMLAARAAAQPAPIADAEFRARRDALVAALPAGAALVAFGERDEIGFPAFFQSPNFRYLTGLDEPNAVLLLVPGAGAPGTLFRQVRPPAEILFNGPLEDSARVRQRTGLAVRALPQFAGVVDSLLAAGRSVYVIHDTRPYGGVVDSLTRAVAFVGALRRRAPAPHVEWADSLVLALRAKKSDTELALVRESARITSESVNDAIRGIRPGQHEYSVQAAIEAGFRARGGDTHTGFATNVSAGEHATTAHHRAAGAPLEAGQLVLMDVGAAYEGYSADLTRTVPVNGAFSPAEREIYQLVRDAQAAAERAATLGAPGGAMEDSASATIARGLARLGLIESPDASFDPPWAERCARNARACRQSYFFYFHGVGHGIGLDVHDPTQHAGARPIAPGDAFTIEPGIYVDARRLALLADTPKNRAFVAKARGVIAKYDGVGVRVEDDYVATARGVERITSAVREIDEIEALMRGGQRAERP